MMHTLTPDPERNAWLLRRIVAILGTCPGVRQVFVFGSFARGEADRWSDIDLLVVTANRAWFSGVYAWLAQAMPVLYRSTFTPQCEPSGGRVLGIVFAGESVFHNLDLNFLTEAEYATPGALDRFGRLRELHASTAPEAPSDPAVLMDTEVESPEEKQVADGIHFTKKALKKLLRGQAIAADLPPHIDHLKAALAAYPPADGHLRGDIIQVARTYLTLAEEAKDIGRG